MKKAIAKKITPKAAKQEYLQVVYRIDALLHTMRAIERREEQLCTIMHAIKTAKGMNSALNLELQQLLEELPARAYQADLDAVHEVTHSIVRSPAKKSARQI